jgi:excisionase family DNA binding protein
MSGGLKDKFGAAEYLATSPRRVDELRRAGKLLAVADGRTYKYAVTDLDEYIQSLPTSAEVRL